MKCWISKDEIYPVYVPNEGMGTEHEVPDALLARWKAALAEFNAVQKELYEIYEAAE